MNKVLLAKFLAAFSALSAGFAIVATRLIIAETEPVTLAFLRFSIGAVCLIPFLIVGFRRNPIVRADWLPVLLLGITLFGIFTWLFSSSLKYTTAAHGAVGLASLPIVTLILAWLFGREQMSRIKIFSVVLAFLGVTVAVSDSLFAEAAGKDLLLGDILMLLATLAVAVYTVFAKPYIARYGPFFFHCFSDGYRCHFIGFCGRLQGWSIGMAAILTARLVAVNIPRRNWRGHSIYRLYLGAQVDTTIPGRHCANSNTHFSVHYRLASPRRTDYH